MEYNVNYKDSPARQAAPAPTQPVRPAPGEPLFASVPGSVYQTSDEECVFKTTRQEERHIMTLQVFQALALCQQFASLGEHNARIRQVLPELGNRPEDVQRVLQALHNRGLLMAAEDFVSGLEESQGRLLPAPLNHDIFGLLVRTADRPDQLATLLGSVSANQRRFGSEYRVVVLDDSRDSENARKNAEVVQAVPGAVLLDAAWQTGFVDALVRDFPEREAQIRYLLERRRDEDFTGGRMWNLALLLSAGHRFLMLDDDIVCAARVMDGDVWEPLLAQRPPRAARFLSSAAEADQAGEAFDFDPVMEHARLLGGVTADALNDERTTSLKADSLWGFEATSWMGLTGHSRIVTSISGTYGDSASASNSWVFVISDQSRKRLWADREDYERYCEGHHVWVNAERFTISPFIGMSPVGLDNRAIMPPTLPHSRNEDFLFNASLRYLYPEAVSVSFPWALGHYRGEERTRIHDARESASGANLAQLLGDLAVTCRGQGMARSGDGRFAGLAGISLGLADNPDDVLLDRVDEHLLFIRSSFVRDLQHQIALNPDAPAFWLADVRKIIETNGRALTAEEVPRLADMPRELSRAASADWLREHLREYGEALSVWPELWQYCRQNPPHMP